MRIFRVYGRKNPIAFNVWFEMVKPWKKENLSINLQSYR